MDAALALSRSNKDFDDDDDDEEFGKREPSSSRKDLTIKVDGKGSGSDQRPNTPRSKHSATEQRRRSKINDRFQILRELIPHSDQKRDKASFLLEVIEYIQFLQEKVQKYESSCPEWNQDNSKLMPWVPSLTPLDVYKKCTCLDFFWNHCRIVHPEVIPVFQKVNAYFRSFWKNAQNNNHTAGDGFADSSNVLKNGSLPSAYMYPGCGIPMAPAMVTGAHATETEISAGAPCRATDATTGFAVADNMASQDQSLWSRPSGSADCAVNSDPLNEHEELTIDEGTASVSAAYSQGVLAAITQSLQSSSVDLSQASIAVQINLGKRAITRNHAATTFFNAMDPEVPTSTHEAVGHSRVGSTGDETSQAAKRHRTDNS